VSGGRPKPKVPDDDHVGDRPTLRPPFDPETYARESESGLRATELPSSSRLTPRAFPRPEVPAFHLARTRSVLPSIPEVHEEAARCGALDAVGADAVPALAIPREELGWVDLSPEATRLLDHVNGIRQLDVVCAMARVAPEDGAATLLQLADEGIVSFL